MIQETWLSGEGGGCQFLQSSRLQLQHQTGKLRKDEAKHLKQMSKSKLRGKDSKRNQVKFHLIMEEGSWLAWTINKDLEDPSETQLGLGTVF